MADWLLRPALRPGSTGQLVSCVVLSKHFGPSSRILAGPVSGEIDLSSCDLSYSFYHFLSILFLSFLSSVCSVVLCAVSVPWSSSGTVVSLTKSSTLETPLEATYSSPQHWGTQVLKPEATCSSPQHWGTQVLKPEATKPSTQGAAHSTIKSSAREATHPSPLHQRNLSTHSQPSSLDHRRKPPADLAPLYRASYTSTTIIQALGQLKALPATTSDEVNFISSKDVDRTLSTIIHPKNTFLHSLEESQASVTEDFCQEEGNTAANSFTDALSAIRELGEQLLCLTAIQHGLANFCSELDAIQQILSNKPANNRVSELQDLLYLFTSLRSQWQTANHPSNPPFKSELNSYLRVLTNLAAEVSTTEDKSDTHPISDSTSFSSPPASCYILGNNYNPTFAMPKLSGDILDWNTFCTSCKSTIEDKKELNRTQRLHCLRETIKHSSLQLLLYSIAGISDFFLEVVAELKEKFNKTQKLYAILCRILINLPGSKHTRTNLSRLVDLSKRTISSLKSTKHCNIDSFLSSLVCSILPSKLQASWAQHTAKETAVPALSQIILFLRESTETLPASGAPLSVNSFKLTPRKNSTKKTDKKQQSQLKQTSHAYSASATSSTPSYNSECVIFKLERHPVHFCPRKQNHTVEQRRSFISSSNLRHNSEGATPPVHAYSILSQPQQLPDALLLTAEVLLQAPGGQQLKARAFINLDAGLSLLSTTTAQALKLTLETSTTLSTVQGTDCKGSQHSNSIIISLHNKLNVQCRPAVMQTVTLNILSQQLAPVNNYLHLLDLQLATNIFNVPGRVNILLGADL